MLYRISEFASITKISARMLRYLDHEGLLKPKSVDDNGYRYYSDYELEIACKINKLRKYHFSYQEIKEILEKHLENDLQLYKQKLSSLKEVVQDYEVLIDEIEANFSSVSAPIANPYDIQFLMRKPYFALTKRSLIQADAIDAFIETAITSVQTKCPCALLGSYYLRFFNEDLFEQSNALESFSENHLHDLGFYQPITESLKIQGFETVLCDETCILSTLHYGSYDHIYNAYIRLFDYIKQEGYIVSGPFSEKYFVDRSLTQNQHEYITEISISVSKCS